jgi:hypothetical protein
MSLNDLWNRSRSQIEDKQIQQVIAFAGDGKLGDGSIAATELRSFLQVVPSALLEKYADQCLAEAFKDSGLALQDIVNEVGRRIGFQVVHGRYRGAPKFPGHDGIWTRKDGHSIVVEVKTTDAYRIDLTAIAGYRTMLAKSDEINLERSSMLVIVGRQDTGDLEAQIRGSRHAWDMRVISVQAMFRMLRLKEELEDPTVVLGRIHEILVPREFTRLDEIVNIAFSAVEDVRLADGEEEDEVDEPASARVSGKKFTPVSFHAACVSRLEKRLTLTLVKQSRVTYSSPDNGVRVLCSISRFHERSHNYWFAFHAHQSEFLDGAPTAYVAFGCGDATRLFVIPYRDFKPWLSSLYQTELSDRRAYWHVKIRETGKSYALVPRSGSASVDLTQYLLRD